MRRTMETAIEHFPIAGSFTISRGAKTVASVVTCTLAAGHAIGRGECVPYGRYGESIESVLAEIERMRTRIEDGIGREALSSVMKAGAARNAVDCALWDLEARTGGITVHQMAGLAPPQALITAYTISLGEPDVMAAQAARYAHRDLLKIKVGTGDDESRIRAVRRAAPDSRIILDANEGWTAATLARHFAICAEERISLIEQPLPAADDAALADTERPVPGVCR